jgi:high-affinity Fe2+/Pb2+ permease
MLLQLSFFLTALTGLLTLGAGAGLVFDLAPYEDMAWVGMAALTIALVAFIFIIIGIAVRLPRRPTNSTPHKPRRTE